MPAPLDSLRRMAFLREALCLVALFATGSGLHAQGPALLSPRNWSQFPAVVEIEKVPPDLYALGDVHGDAERLLRLLRGAGLLVDDRWAAGSAILVCTGDMIDKGPRSLDVLARLRNLQDEAAEAGGRVILLMGNHEAAFLAAPGNFKAREFARELTAQKLPPALVAAGHDPRGIGAQLRALPLAARVGPWFFAHAGNTRGRTLKQLRTELREAIDTHGYDPDLPGPVSALLDARLHPHPWWELASEAPTQGVARLQSYVHALGARHLVVGHQPGKIIFAAAPLRPRGTVAERYGGLLYLIDVGMSRGIEGGAYSDGALLHIRQDRDVSVLHANGRRELVSPGAPTDAARVP